MKPFQLPFLASDSDSSLVCHYLFADTHRYRHSGRLYGEMFSLAFIVSFLIWSLFFPGKMCQPHFLQLDKHPGVSAEPSMLAGLTPPTKRWHCSDRVAPLPVGLGSQWLSPVFSQTLPKLGKNPGKHWVAVSSLWNVNCKSKHFADDMDVSLIIDEGPNDRANLNLHL